HNGQQKSQDKSIIAGPTHSRVTRRPRYSSQQIRFCQIQEFGPAAVEYGLEHIETETLHLLRSNGWRHRKLLAIDDDFHQRRAFMLESLEQHRTHLLRSFCPQTHYPDRLRQLREIRILKASRKLQNSRCLHFQLDKTEGGIVEDDDFDRQIQLPQCEQVAHEHG